MYWLLFYCYDNTPRSRQLTEELIWGLWLRRDKTPLPSWWRSTFTVEKHLHSGEAPSWWRGSRALRAQTYRQEAESEEAVVSFLLLIQSRTQLIKQCLPQHRCAFVPQPILENSLRSGLRLVSIVILSLTKLTTKIDHHLPNKLGT